MALQRGESHYKCSTIIDNNNQYYDKSRNSGICNENKLFIYFIIYLTYKKYKQGINTKTAS